MAQAIVVLPIVGYLYSEGLKNTHTHVRGMQHNTAQIVVHQAGTHTQNTSYDSAQDGTVWTVSSQEYRPLDHTALTPSDVFPISHGTYWSRVQHYAVQNKSEE